MVAMLPFALALLGAPALPSACSVMSRAEAQGYVGEPISQVVPEAPAPDEETGSIHTTCTYIGKARALVISIDEFKSADAAQRKMTAEYLKAQDTDDDEGPPPTIEPESGLGDRAYYGQSPHAAMILMVKGAVILFAAVMDSTRTRVLNR